MSHLTKAFLIYMFKKYQPLFIIGIIIAILLSSSAEPVWTKIYDPGKILYPSLSAHQKKVLNFIEKNKEDECLIVDKEKHLLYYIRNGKIIKNDPWNGRLYSFPVPISIARGGRYKTPEGEFFIDVRNRWSRYTRFLGFSYPGAYGIHAGPTYLARYYERLEKRNPKGRYVTRRDDTRGCVATETLVMRYLFANVKLKTPLFIY